LRPQEARAAAHNKGKQEQAEQAALDLAAAAAAAAVEPVAAPEVEADRADQG